MAEMATDVDVHDKLPEGFVFAESVDFQAGHNIYIRNLRATVVDTDYPLIYYVFEGQEEVKHRSFAATPYQFSVSQADRELHATEAAEEDDEDNDSDSTSAHPGDSDDGNSSDEDSSDRYRSAANAASSAESATSDNNNQAGEEKTTADASTDAASGDDSTDGDDESGVKTMPPLKEAADSVMSHIKSRPPNHEFRNIVGGEHSTDAEFPQAVCFTECKEAIFEVKNKVAQVALDKCTDITVKLASVISSVEISNANDCRIECSGKCNSFVIEKSIGCEIQLVDAGDDVIIVSTRTDDTTVQITAGPDSSTAPPAPAPSTSSSESESSGDDAKKETNSTELKSEDISSFPVTYIIKEDTSDLPTPTPSEPGFEYVNDIPQFITKYDAAAHKISTSLMKRDARGAIENLN